jgi:hypothetical protein
MYLTDEILDKLNARSKTKNNLKKTSSDKQVTLPDIMLRSFAELKELAGDAITQGEKNFLYQQAQKALKENKMAESRILSRANPQLANAVRLGIRQTSMLRSYGDLFPQRASSFVSSGSVASMFSPAGYLTELYREARSLHADTSPYHLDKRRTDLASLSLSQSNMDDELSTLSLSNELLLNNIQSQERMDYDGIMEMLATYRLTVDAPYNQPYEACRQSIVLQDPEFKAFCNNPSVTVKMDTISLLSIQAGISPGLWEILTEKITVGNADDLITKNFGDISPSSFQSVAYLANWYGLTYDEIRALLDLVNLPGNITPGVQYYQNDQLISLLESNGVLNTVLITRTSGENVSQQNYAELIPLGEDKFQFNYNFSVEQINSDFSIGTKGFLSDDLRGAETFTPLKNTPYSTTFSLSKEQLSQPVEIGMSRTTKGRGTFSSYFFRQDTYPFSVFLLRLNKLIRLYKATGIALSDIRSVIESNNNDLTIAEDVLCQLFRVSDYMQRYWLSLSAALVLSGANIGQTVHDNQVSAFTRLFNSPMLNNTEFYADGTPLQLTPAEVTDTFRSGVIKRAFGVGDTELYTLWSLVQGSNAPRDFTCTVDNLSALYRIKLLADVNGLTVTELAALLSVSPYASTPVGGLSDKGLSTLVSFTDRYTQWLKDMNWTVSDLYLMLTARFSTMLSPDIENLIATLKNGLANQDFSKAGEAELITAAAPFIAAATQLDSTETARAVLQWLSQLQPQALTVAGFLMLVDSDSKTDAETSSMVAYCQVMGQLALIVRNTGLSASELSWVVAHPTIITEKATALGHDISTLYEVTQLHSLLARCGTYAAEILTSLSGRAQTEKNTLAVNTVATALGLDEQALAQALAQCSSYVYFYSWVHLRDALQWLDVATTLGITPANVAKLVKLTWSSPYADWVAASHTLQAGLDTEQTAQMSSTLDEALSAALSGYVIKNIAPSWVTDRDKVYNWLLIDNQVSAQIKTTRIAEAIASVQLYVNRALSGQEDGVVSMVKSRAFFTSDWDTYNKRYSTWAGVSQLVYYPENYIDPTLRIGQTGMMDEMLQSLGQSQLTSDTVEDAFKTYMTRFEEVANLDVISGYHDSVSDQNGTTYLIGKSAIGDYYWRSADISKLSGGKLPANAWGEWEKITVGISPVENLIRPVIFHSRLYIVWAESRDMATTTNGTTKKSVEYLLKYAHILHDGTWSAPVPVVLDSSILPFPYASIDNTGMYCAKDAELEKLYIYFYEKEDTYSELPENIAGLSLFPDGSVENIPPASAVKTAGYIYLQLDTTAAVRLNTPYTGGETRINISGTTANEGGWGDLYYTYMSGGKLSVLTAELSGDNIVINFNATARLVYNGYEGSRSRTQVNMMKSIGNFGETFYLPQTVNKSDNASNSGRDFECAMKRNTNSYDYDTAFLVTDSLHPVTGDTLYGFHLNSINSLNSAINLRFAHRFEETKGNSKLWIGRNTELTPMNYISALMTPLRQGGIFVPVELMFSDFKIITTSMNTDNVRVLVGGEIFTADMFTKSTFGESLFTFRNNKVSIPLTEFSGSKAQIDFTMHIVPRVGDDRGSLGSEIHTLTLTRVDESNMPVISLNKTTDSAQYLQYGVYRIRVNTLFAKQLVARANLGINAILSMETQLLQEPSLGKGAFVGLTFNKYDESVNGSSRAFKILMCDVYVKGDEFVLASGMLSDTQQTSCSFFVPRLDESTESPVAMYICANYQRGNTNKLKIKQNNGIWEVDSSYNKGTFNGLAGVSVMGKETEPMDFSGANALYFWEMFYYVPMMVFKRLLSESKFTEATQWIKYIWRPDGYLVNGQPAIHTWNVRPLEDEITWHANPLDSVDPDAVAQADPLHYKIATFMAWLDLLIARGDAAYRQFDRDTLNEAKMWYVQALGILGYEPYVTQNSNWANPRLDDAADETTQKDIQQALMVVRQQGASDELRTANSLGGLFLPQQNEKLAGYWQTLAQRLYNLRHNLSIDGNPLSLPIYTPPADPAALLSAAVNASSGGPDFPLTVMPLYRFPVILESATKMVSQLSQFGSTLLGITERQDAEAMSELLQNQGAELVLQSIALQINTISEIDADKATLKENLSGAQSRLDSYTTLYNEDVNTGEKQTMDLALAASVLSTTATTSYTVAAALDAIPNIYGMAFGGSRYGGIPRAIGNGIEIAAGASRTAAERLGQSEIYRRRRQEWGVQRNAAQSEVDQINAQLAAQVVRREGAMLQKTYLETQQSQTQAQMTFLKNKFTSKALYNWLRGKLSAIYYQFYDLTVSRCLMAQEAYKWALGIESASFIRPGAWQGTYAGLMAGETLMLSLAQMEQSWLQKDQREKEVVRTVCLSDVYAGLSTNAFTLADQVVTLVTAGRGSVGTAGNGLSVTSDKQLQATLTLSGLNIGDNYPSSLGKNRRIKQISVTLPALVGPYQDVRAVLSYGDPKGLAKGCDVLAVSHGMNDSGQFQLNFNDDRWLPFEGIPVDSSGVLTLSFPQADSSQKDLLLSLTDIILHIRYTIAN